LISTISIPFRVCHALFKPPMSAKPQTSQAFRRIPFFAKVAVFVRMAASISGLSPDLPGTHGERRISSQVIPGQTGG
jgi:hypothetical protein